VRGRGRTIERTTDKRDRAGARGAGKGDRGGSGGAGGTEGTSNGGAKRSARGTTSAAGPGSRKLAMRDSHRTAAACDVYERTRGSFVRSLVRSFVGSFVASERATRSRASPSPPSIYLFPPFGRPPLAPREKEPPRPSPLPATRGHPLLSPASVRLSSSRLASSTRVAEPLSSAITSRYFALFRARALVRVDAR